MRTLLVMILMVVGMVAHADPRIVTEIYNTNRVYSVYTRIGWTVAIQFEDDEVLTTERGALGLGDSEAWMVSVRANSVLLKPKAIQPDTNIIAVTNKRTYSIDLKTASKGSSPTYILRFSYPDAEAANAAAAKKAALIASARAMPVSINTDYTYRGDALALKPTAAYDDGRFTHLVYNHAGELPVFYKEMPDGSEALVNDHIDKDGVVFHEVVRRVKARLGNSVLEIINHGYVQPAFNLTGAGVHGAVRGDKD